VLPVFYLVLWTWFSFAFEGDWRLYSVGSFPDGPTLIYEERGLRWKVPGVTLSGYRTVPTFRGPYDYYTVYWTIPFSHGNRQWVVDRLGVKD